MAAQTARGRSGDDFSVNTSSRRGEYIFPAALIIDRKYNQSERYSVRLTETGVAALRGGALARPELP